MNVMIFIISIFVTPNNFQNDPGISDHLLGFDILYYYSSTSTATSTRHQLIKTCSCATTVLVLKYQVVG